MHDSDVKDIQKDLSFLNATDIRCVICAKTEKKKHIKTHDLKFHMKKGIRNGYSCEYFSRSFLAYNKST